MTRVRVQSYTNPARSGTIETEAHLDQWVMEKAIAPLLDLPLERVRVQYDVLGDRGRVAFDGSVVAAWEVDR